MIFNPLFLGGLKLGEILIIVLVILLLFGAKRIPDLMKSMGKGVKSFKQGMKEVEDEINSADDVKTQDTTKDSSES